MIGTKDKETKETLTEKLRAKTQHNACVSKDETETLESVANTPTNTPKHSLEHTAGVLDEQKAEQDTSNEHKAELGEPDNPKQQKERTLSRSPIFIAAAVVFAIIIAITLVFFITNKNTFQPQGANDTMGVLRNISSQVSVADDTISSMNSYISQNVSDDNQSGINDTLQGCPTALQALDDAYSIYDVNRSFLSIQTSDEMMSSLETSISKRKDLITSAQVMLNASIAVKNSASELEGVFSEVNTAATDMDNASTTIANNTSSTAAKQALEYDKSAREHLQNAKDTSQKISDKLTLANDGEHPSGSGGSGEGGQAGSSGSGDGQAGSSGGDAQTGNGTQESGNAQSSNGSTQTSVKIEVDTSALTSLNAYLDKLLEAADFSIQADEALISNDSSSAQDLQNKSTSSLEQASALKSSISLNENDFAKSLYYSLKVSGTLTADAEEQYRQAASQVSDADKVVSAYMAARS